VPSPLAELLLDVELFEFVEGVAYAFALADGMSVLTTAGIAKFANTLPIIAPFLALSKNP
jgi:hypothetical protein